jgi:hypothetical protein
MEFQLEKEKKRKELRKEIVSIYGFQHVFWWLCVPCRFPRSTFPIQSSISSLLFVYFLCARGLGLEERLWISTLFHSTTITDYY